MARLMILPIVLLASLLFIHIRGIESVDPFDDDYLWEEDIQYHGAGADLLHHDHGEESDHHEDAPTQEPGDRIEPTTVSSATQEPLAVTTTAPVAAAAVVEDQDETASLNAISRELPVLREHPCLKVKCGHGRECTLADDDSSGAAVCSCIRECADNSDSRRQVCSSLNTTWQSDCHFHRHRCLCEEEMLLLGTADHQHHLAAGESSAVTESSKLTLKSATEIKCLPEHTHMHIDYYGPCQQIEDCPPAALKDFPRRLREWLSHIMTSAPATPSPAELSDASLAGPLKARLLAQEWVDSVIYKFCDAERPAFLRRVSRHDLFPLRAPLLSMEPCIGLFLDQCDADNDHAVTLLEWNACLGLKESDFLADCSIFKSLRSF